MNGEIDIYGLYVPELLFGAAIALVLQSLLSRLFARVGLYRIVWHPPLVDISLFVICLGAVVFVMHRI